MPTAETAPDHITDLDLAATYASTLSKFATRARDVRTRGAMVARLLGEGRTLPTADQCEADFLADFDRLAVIAERIRATRANADVGRAA